MELSGRLATFSATDVLQWCEHERRTGSIRFRAADNELQVALSSGQIVGCFSTNPAQFFARHLLLEGLISDAELFQVVLRTKIDGTRMGQALVALGSLSAKEVRRTLTQHVFDSVCGVVLWRHGVFSFSSWPPDLGDPQLASEPINPLTVAVEGSRWRDELGTLRTVIPHDDVLLRPGPAWPGDHLGPRQRRMLAKLDREQRVRDLLRTVGGSYFRFMQALVGLVKVGSLEVRPAEEEAPADDQRALLDSWAREAVDGLLEELQQAGSVPLQCLEKLYPVYLVGPTGEGEDAALRRGELDGTRRLGDWLQQDDETRQRQVRWLVAELQAGRVALLPAPGGIY